MCGVAGCFHPDGTRCRSAIDAQLTLLRHRGPDSTGSAVEPGGTVGQARLAVIDLVTGDPPISEESGTVHAVLNGEIYNFRELRKELSAAGHTLTTRGDTEVLAHLAEDLDPVELARRLEGMFAFAVYDARRRRLVLGRDRFGVKPLYVWSGSGTVVFASEPKGVLAHPGVPRDLDAGVLPDYLAFGYPPSPRTFYAGIEALPPAHVMVVERGREPVVTRYWYSPLVRDTSGPTDLGGMVGPNPGASTALGYSASARLGEAAARVRELLDAAVSRRLVADVPLGAFLSGGIDSSAIVALMAQHTATPVRTFTIGFEDTGGYDERPFASTIAKRYKTDHTEFVVRPDAASLVEELVDHHDAPFGDSSGIPTYLLSKLTRTSVTVALCGDGGDEMFCGYERFAAANFLAKLERWPRAAGNLLARAVAATRRFRDTPSLQRATRMLEARDLGATGAFSRWMHFTAPEWIGRLLPAAPDGFQSIGTQYDTSLAAVDPGTTTMQALQQANIDTYLLDDLLPKVDRASMAHGLEVRSPFLDRELAEYALTLPDRSKVLGPSLKRVLKEAVADLLPPEILRRPKHGFGVPLDRWFRTDLKAYLEDRLCSPSAHLRRHLDGDAVDALFSAHMAGQDLGATLWTLLTLEVFLRREGW